MNHKKEVMMNFEESMLALIEEKVAPFVEEIMEEERKAPQDPFRKKDDALKTKREEYLDHCTGKKQIQRMQHALDIIAKNIEKEPVIFQKHLEEEIQSGREKMRYVHEQTKNPPASSPEKQEEYTVADLIGLSEKTINHFYHYGTDEYKNGHFANASDIFFYICFIQPLSYEPWFALGMAEQQQERYAEALAAYASATLNQYEEIHPFLQSSICYQKLGQENDALNCLKTALSFCEQNPSAYPQALKNSIQLEMQKLSQKKS